jgi:hypothetical protein
MKKVMATMMLLTGGLFAAPHVAVRFGIGVPVWTDGFYEPNGVWVAGYWAPPVVRVAPEVRVAPRRDFAHDFHDRDHGRDFHGDEHFRR